MIRTQNMVLVTAVAAASLLAASSARASIITTSAAKYTNSTIDLTNDVAAGMNTNVDWIHFLTGNLNFHGTSTITGTVTADLAKNVTPLINRTITVNAKPGATSNDWVQASQSTGGISCTYSDAVTGSGSIAKKGLFQQDDVILSITVPDTNAYVLSIWTYDAWTHEGIKSVSLSDGTTGSATWVGGTNNTDLYRIDIAFQASQPNETLTVAAACQAYGQAFTSPAVTLSTNIVPEPASLGLLGLGVLAMLRRRRA